MKNYNYPDKNGQFGQYGGKFVPPALENVLKEVERAYLELRDDPKFIKELNYLHRVYTGRPSPLYLADSLTKNAGGAKIYLKREDLNHTGAHKINNTLGQALVARKLGKTKLIAETGAGQHGVAVATVAAKFGMECDIYMGERDVVNQHINVYRMKLLGARVVPVTTGQKTLKDAIDVALGAFINEPETYYMLGSAVGPHPYPMMVRDFQSVIGREAKKQILKAEGRLPDYAVACVGGGSNALGLFYEFIPDEEVKLVAVEPAGKGADTNQHGLALGKGKLGVIHGFKCLVLQDDQGEIMESYSAASGLDYPGVGPEFCLLKDLGRVETVGVTDVEAVEAFQLLSETEGIIPALESAHAVFYAVKLAGQLDQDRVIVVNLSGRGDKDVKNVYENLINKEK
ncbi:tryptophan synthase subunit beta [Patescibacteria group bacterium]|nr:tryptophan synthase subunit beta [Patescibacteria group bacterium]MBU1967222.1 tryptophan synthase subunit beta [Patescibacteria group bacterium]MBU2543083.1 tryptophan synthase subunit beta [Patescibacteria group bacterium]